MKERKWRVEQRRGGGCGGGGGGGDIKNWVCHQAIPLLDQLPQKQMYGVNTAWITAPGR